jgi:hypothetical protein
MFRKLHRKRERRCQVEEQVEATIRDMTEWLEDQQRCCEWSPVWERVEEWRDELATAIRPGKER